MREKNMRAIGAVGVFACSGVALGGGGGGFPGTITDGNTSYTFNGADTNGSANWDPGDLVSGDQLFQSWWWYRVQGQSREYSFGNGFPDTTDYSGNTATFTGDESDANVRPGDVAPGLTWNMTWSVTENPIINTLDSTVAVTNTTDDPIIINIFHYGDIDLNGAQGDSATVDDVGRIVVSDEGTPGVTIDYTGFGADAYQIEPRDQLLRLLNDNEITNLTNENNVMLPADFTAGFQWIDVVLAPGETEEFSIGFRVIPAPGATAIFALAGLAGLRRRRG